MALSLTQTDALTKLLKPGLRIASMGYPDMIFTKEIESKWKVNGQYRSWEESKKICARHGLEDQNILDAHDTFNRLGCILDVFDIVQERGSEIVLDLNNPVDKSVDSRETYDLVLDVGTLEHCFNISQALFNMAGMVKVGGRILHENPYNCGNHGFYNLNPTFFHDFYTENGFEVETLNLVSRDGRWTKPPPTGRFKFTPEELNVFCQAKRVEVKTFVYPVQTKYKPAAGVDRAKGVING